MISLIRHVSPTMLGIPIAGLHGHTYSHSDEMYILWTRVFHRKMMLLEKHRHFSQILKHFTHSKNRW